jgi:hypothetical protein
MSLEVRTFWRDTPDKVADVSMFKPRMDQLDWVDDKDFDLTQKELAERKKKRADAEKNAAKKKAEAEEKRKNDPAVNVKEKDEKK